MASQSTRSTTAPCQKLVKPLRCTETQRTTPVRSVAAGEVIAAVDTVPETTPHEPLHGMSFANLSGNCVTVRIAGNRYFTYAHLRLGSVRVRVHEHVAAGQFLGLLGNAGQATAPHFSGALMFQNEMRVQSR